MKIKHIILSLTLILVCIGHGSSEELFYGQWKIEKIISTPGITPLTQEQAESVLGKTLYFSPEVAIFDEISICKNPTYKKRILTESEFFDESRLYFEHLNITEELMLKVIIYDNQGQLWDQAPGRSLIVKNNDVLIAGWKGVYYELIRDFTPNKY